MSCPGCDFRALWERAMPYRAFVDGAEDLKGLWEGVYRRALVPEWAAARARLVCDAKLLVINETWCWDGANVLPPLQRLSDQTGCLEIRVLRREEHPEVMRHYLTNGGRAIPIVIVLDEAFREIGHWGPRPAALQAWVREHRDRVEKGERYRFMRRWHVEDQGGSTYREVLEVVEAGGVGTGRAAPAQ